MWTMRLTVECEVWFNELDARAQRAIVAVIQVLRERGPGLGRPLVDMIRGSRHANMKELRPLGGNLRILFAFDPRRQAILLIGGDKTHRWQAWYRDMIPKADRLYDAHLAALEEGHE